MSINTIEEIDFFPGNIEPDCKPPLCYVGNYPTPAKPGSMGPFLVNTYLLQHDRRSELGGGPVPLTSKTLTDLCA